MVESTTSELLIWFLCTDSQQEIVSLYNRFCQLDRKGGGFISADEFLSIPEFAVNPLSQVLLLLCVHFFLSKWSVWLRGFTSTSIRTYVMYVLCECTRYIKIDLKNK